MGESSAMSPEHKLLAMMRAKSSRNAKKEMLLHFKGSVKLKNIFLYALDPFKKYYIKQFPDDVVGVGDKVIDDSTWSLLDRLAARQVTGKAAKRELFDHMCSLTAMEAHLLKKIMLNDLNVGVAAGTVNSVWPKSIVERFTQKAEDWDIGQAVWPCYAGLKLDGIRADYKNGVFTARSGHVINGLDHIKEDIEAKGGGYWDGELIAPLLAHLGFDTVSGYIRSGRTAKPEVRFVVFDNLTIAPLKQSIRLSTLPKVFSRYFVSLKADNDAATYLHHLLMKDEVGLMSYFSRALSAGQEGLMVKHPRARYRAGRTYNWMKLKKGESGEFEIVGYYRGEGRLKDTLGGIVVQATPNTTVRVGSGPSDQERDKIWAEPNKILGRLATVNYMEKTKDGSLRHPVYKNIRWDL